MAVSETGKTMVVWANGDGKMRARYRTANRGWSKVMRVAGYGATASPETPDLDIAEDGTAVVGWRSDRKRSLGAQMVAMFHPNRGFRRPMRVGAKPKLNVRLPFAQGQINAVSARRGGKGTAVWLSSCDGSPETLRPGWSVNLDIRRGATRPARIPFSKCPHAETSLSENARGRAVLAINGHGFSPIVRVAIRPAGKRRFRKAVRISPKAMRASFAKVSVHRNGSATLVAPTFNDHGPAGMVGLRFFNPRVLNEERDQITPLWTGGGVVGTNNRGDVAVLAHNVETLRWIYTSRSPAGPFGPSVELPFENYLNKPAMTIDPSAIAVGPSGKAVAATARASWIGERHTGEKGIYVFEGFPRPSD